MKTYLATLFLSLSILTNSAQAESNKPLPTLQLLELKDEIREASAKYTMLVDRIAGEPDGRQWVDGAFTKDAVLRGFHPNGEKFLELTGREAIYDRFGRARARPDQSTAAATTNRHFMVNIVFESVAEDEIKTITNAMSISTLKDNTGSSCDGCSGTPKKISIFIYYDTWKKENNEWKKSISDIHFRN